MPVSGELSRKIAEKLGAVSCRNLEHGYYWEFQGKFYVDGSELTGKSLPDFLSPAVFWPEFEKWLPPNSTLEIIHFDEGLRVRKLDGFTHKFVVGMLNVEHVRFGHVRYFEGKGKSIAEAGCLAWLQALEAGVK